MIRFAVLAALIAVFLWAPWMDQQTAEQYAEYILAAYGPMPAACYDSDDALLQEGVEVRWYPMGRLVHTCTGDYVVWFWRDVKELGGITKRAEEIQVVLSKPLSCDEVIDRQDARRSTSTQDALRLYDGPVATEIDLALFPGAADHRAVIMRALRQGVNYAGRFVVAEWGCGTACQEHAVVDAESGLVVAYGLQTEFGVLYSTSSPLFITNPQELLPELPDDPYTVESLALSIARVPREYYRMTYDVLSETYYMIRECVESGAAGYIEVEDDRIGVIQDE